MRHLHLVVLLLVCLGTAACGGGGTTDPTGPNDTGLPGDPGDPAPLPPEGPAAPNPGPQIALLLSNGHSPLAPDYLSVATGPQLDAAVRAAGLSVQTSYFTDDGTSYQSFVAKLQQIRDEWIDGVDVPTRVVIVGHSHGCVRSHAAMRAVQDCPIELAVDLDGSSIGWSTLAHGGDNALIGGAPEGAYPIGAARSCLGVDSAGGPHDLEDVVLAHVKQGYEVRSGDRIFDPQNILQLIEYDERWNVRPDGSDVGLTCVFSGTPHAEVAAPGITLAAAQSWIVTQLTAP